MQFKLQKWAWGALFKVSYGFMLLLIRSSTLRLWSKHKHFLVYSHSVQCNSVFLYLFFSLYLFIFKIFWLLRTVQLLWSKEPIFPLKQNALGGARFIADSLSSRSLFIFYTLYWFFQLLQAASMSITSVLYLKDEVSIATAGAVDRYLWIAFARIHEISCSILW